MEYADRIVAFAALLGSLVLVMRGSRFRAMSGAQGLKLAAVWVGIFLIVVLLASVGEKLIAR